MVKNQPATWETWVQSLGWEDPLEEGMATHSSILAWRITMDCSPLGSSVHGDSPGKNTGVGCNALLQGIFPTQGLNPSLPHCRCILYCLNHQGSHLYFSEGVFLIHEIISFFKFYEYFNRFLKMDLGPFRNLTFFELL